MYKHLVRVLVAIETLLFFIPMAYAQSTILDLPRASQHAVVTQRLGITDVSINYHRPAGQQTQDMGQHRALWRRVAGRRQRKYHHCILGSGRH